MDTGAERSTVQRLPLGCKKSKETAYVIGAKGEPFEVPVLKDVIFETSNKVGIGSLLLVPEAEYNLLGRDLIIELGINIQVVNREIQIRLCPLRVEDEKKMDPGVWYTPETVGRLQITPFMITIVDPKLPTRVKQYPIPREGRLGLKVEIDRLLEKGLLEPCMSPFNTPILPVKKSDGSYRLVHDLRK